MNIRIASEKDIPKLNELLFQVHKIHADARPDIFITNSKKYNDDELKQLIQDHNKTSIFVAEADGVVVGYAFCQVIRESDNSRVQNTLYIDDLCVDENLRGCHIGSDLLNFVVNYAKENNFYNITLNVWALNEKALKFYEKHGMHIQKYGMEKIV